MKISLFTQFGALNSKPVFDAFAQGLDALGLEHNINDMSADVAVIWSMLWQGRMAGNRDVWDTFRKSGRPVIVLEVGMLDRGRTWKVGLNGTNGAGWFGDVFEDNRAAQLGIKLQPWTNSGEHILIAVQRTDSGQWIGLPPIDQWLDETVSTIRKFSQRPIVIRSHPRQKLQPVAGCIMQTPNKITNSYDSFDFDNSLKNAWAVVNENSGPGSQAVIAGVPAFVGFTSLASIVANLLLSDIENPQRPDRETWLNHIAHTEWTVDEIASGYPIERLLNSNIFHTSSSQSHNVSHLPLLGV